MEENFKRTNTIARIERIIEIVKNAVKEETSNRHEDKNESNIYWTADNFFSDIDFYTNEEIGEPGYSMHPNGVVLIAYNWNVPDCIRKNERLNDLFKRMIKLFDNISETYWGGSWSRCGDCSKLYLTQPDCMSWTPHLHEMEGEYVCSKCISKDPAEYIQLRVNNPTRQDTIELDNEVYKEFGYELLLDDDKEAKQFGVQFYRPEKLIKQYNEAGYKDVIIQVFDAGEYFVNQVYRIYVDSESAKEVEEKKQTKLQERMENFHTSCSQEEYQEHVDCYDGICLACGEWVDGGHEPDAQHYLCPYCGQKAVSGTEMALIGGYIEFTE